MEYVHYGVCTMESVHYGVYALWMECNMDRVHYGECIMGVYSFSALWSIKYKWK